MPYLLLASLIWAFSFGLLGNILAGVSPSFVALVRLALAALLFLPLLRRLPVREAARLMAVGGVQFGLMYLCYNAAFACLPSYQVALFTVLTPLYVILLAEAERQRRLAWGVLLAALLAVAGAALVAARGRGLLAPLTGVLLVQASNLCFAMGQLAYRRWARGGAERPADHAVMGWLYLGGALVAAPGAALALTQTPLLAALTAQQVLALVYLGLVASGLGFFLWNAGARRSAPGVLAVFNNLKIPLAAAVSLLIFHEQTDVPRLLAGGTLLLAAMVISHRLERP